MNLRIIIAAAVLLCASSAALAQPGRRSAQLERFDRQLDLIRQENNFQGYSGLPVAERVFLDYGAYLSYSIFSIDDFNGENHVLQQYEASAYARLNIDNVHEFFVRARARYNHYNEGDSFNGDDNDWDDLYLEQAFYKFDARRYVETSKGHSINWDLNVTAGREIAYWANGLVLNEIVDGADATFTFGKFAVRGIAGVTAEHQADFDSSRPGFDNHMSRGFFGGMVGFSPVPQHTIYAYGLVQQDYNEDTVLIVGSTLTRFDYNSWYIGLGANGALGSHWLYGLEFAYEGGNGLSNSFNNVTLAPILQTYEDISAWALDAKIEYVFGGARRTRAAAEVLFASGDDDRLVATNTFGGNQSGTKDKGFNAFGLINTGLAYGGAVSNLAMLRIGGNAFPFPNCEILRNLQVGVDFFTFFKLDTDAPIDEPTVGKNFLGVEPDIYVNWQVFSDLFVSVRYGVFLPGAAIASTKEARQFIYFNISWGF